MGTRAASIVAVVLVTGCGGNAEYRCDSPGRSCGAGTCELTTGFCSVPDSNCPSGRRYDGTLAGDLSGQCVGGGTPPSDGGVDVGIDTPPPDAPLFCYGTAPISICFAAAPTGPQTYSGTIDTGSSPMCATNVVSGGTGLCVLAGSTITFGGRLRATGTKPLVLLATDSINVNATIDVGSHRGMTPDSGAGSDPAVCSTMAGTAPTVGGGGAGGSFVAPGGAGGVSALNNSTGGTPGTVVSLTNLALRGGCPGQDGDGLGKGTGGHAGGAVLMIASTIMIQGDILAGGEGGDAASMNSSGGGGGGAGGTIWLDAPTVTNPLNNLVIANGGAGGEGSGMTNTGQPGQDGTTLGAATGGHGSSPNGGDGGDGSSTTAAGAGNAGAPGSVFMSAPGGGGAGGGGAGIVKARVGAGVNLGTKVSPAITPQQ
ncbi:MAG TPA: hypothetical protein VHW23_38955 [Kofleriaceae bacterium]|nr:hypothetical protein [Kofleriaceae bacterium]